MKTTPDNFIYDEKSELKRALFDIFMRMEYYGGREGIEEMEVFLNELLFTNQPKETLLEDLREHLLNGEFEEVKVPEGTRLRCLEWVDKERKNFNKSNSKIKKPLSFKEIFRPEFRDKIPNEVLRLLGPGEADAWVYDASGNREWDYGGPKLAVVTPFHILCSMGKITIPPKCLQDYITVWLNEFGVGYEKRIYDKPSHGRTFDHFDNYLSQLPK